MVLYKYFRPQEQNNCFLPKPDGPLSAVMPSSSPLVAKKEVKTVLDCSNDCKKKRGNYEHFSKRDKAKIAKYAAENGVTAAIRHFSKAFPGRLLKESSVRTWKMKYLRELSLRTKAGKDTVIEELLTKKSSRPLILGETLDNIILGETLDNIIRKRTWPPRALILLKMAELHFTEDNYVKKPNTKSIIWKYFSVRADSKGVPLESEIENPVCDNCKKCVPAKCSNTTNLFRHLEDNHLLLLLKLALRPVHRRGVSPKVSSFL